MKNSEYNDEKKDVDVCGHNYHEDHGPFLTTDTGKVEFSSLVAVKIKQQV